MKHHDRFFTLGVAYYPDYIYDGQLTRLATGAIKKLSIDEHMRVDFARMQAAGISAIRIGEFSWGHVEPQPGQLHTATFTRALDLAQEHGIEVTVCTPTATPPKWLTDRHPEVLPITRSGYTIRFGGRRQYDPTNPLYRAESRRITEIYAKAFGSHPAVTAWQTDNELANHSSAQCFTDSVRTGFRAWLQRYYGGDIAKLNEEWFTCFWSHHYPGFADIDLPVSNWTDPNPGLELAYRRYMSEAFRDFQRDQVEIIRRLSPGRPVTHNITPMLFDVCLWQLTEDLDFAGYDHYQMAPVPDPTSSASQYHLMRSLKGGRKFVVLEQQPVQVNWQPVNGRWGIDWLFLWGMQAAFLGSDGMYYFSWQRFYGGSEQYHDGVVPHDLRIGQSRQEKVIKAKGQVFAALRDQFNLPSLPLPTAPVLMVQSMESLWAHDICSQTKLWNAVKLSEELQLPFLRAGIGVDMTPSVAAAGAKLQQYQLLVLPGYAFELSAAERQLIKEFIAAGGHVWSLPRTGMKDNAGRMSPFPLELFDRDDFYFDEHGGLLEDEHESIRLEGVLGNMHGKIWAEKIVLQNGERWEATAHFNGGLYDGSPAILHSKGERGEGSYVHFAFWPVMTEAVASYVLRTFQLQPTLSAAFAADVQTYSFRAGTRRFAAAINFGTTPEELDVPGAAETHLVGYRAHLRKDLSLNASIDDVRLSSQQSLTLAGREIGFWEIK